LKVGFAALFTAFAAAIALASVIAAAIVVAANATAAALRVWLVVVSPTPSSAARSVIRPFRHRAIVNTFTAGRHPLLPTFASHCPISTLPLPLMVGCCVLCPPSSGTYFDLLRVYTPFLRVGTSLTSTSRNGPEQLR